jgi:hypothetical protein
MTKQQFIESLEKDNLSKEEKIEVCQYFIDEYPVNITMTDMFGREHLEPTKLIGITITSGSDLAVNRAYTQLKKHIDKFKE